MSIHSAGGDHTADAMPRTPNPVNLSPPLVRHKRLRKLRPGSVVVKPSVRIAASKALPAAEGAPPDTMLVHGRPATASSAAATPAAASADLEQRPPAAWHWGPPDPVKAAAWAGARKAVRFASLPADAARGAAQIVSYPVRWVVSQSVLHVRPGVDIENTKLRANLSDTEAQALRLTLAKLATCYRKAMSVARAYVPLSGSQMYVLPTRITANAQDLATSAARTPAPGGQVQAHLHSAQFAAHPSCLSKVTLVCRDVNVISMLRHHLPGHTGGCGRWRAAGGGHHGLTGL